jgi:hypothetical protein
VAATGSAEGGATTGSAGVPAEEEGSPRRATRAGAWASSEARSPAYTGTRTHRASAAATSTRLPPAATIWPGAAKSWRTTPARGAVTGTRTSESRGARRSTARRASAARTSAAAVSLSARASSAARSLPARWRARSSVRAARWVLAARRARAASRVRTLCARTSRSAGAKGVSQSRRAPWATAVPGRGRPEAGAWTVPASGAARVSARPGGTLTSPAKVRIWTPEAVATVAVVMPRRSTARGVSVTVVSSDSFTAWATVAGWAACGADGGVRWQAAARATAARAGRSFIGRFLRRCGRVGRGRGGRRPRARRAGAGRRSRGGWRRARRGTRPRRR